MISAALVKLLGGTPFKAQNMSLNSYPTADGGEIAFIQAYQAIGADVEPSRSHNPVLLKPSPLGVEVVLMGESVGVFRPSAYYDTVSRVWPKIAELVRETSVIEGAGSVAEPNFMERDLSAFLIARELKVPIVLVLDVDRGGAFASAFGAYNMLPSSVRGSLKGFIINKFRGDPALIEPAIKWLEERTGMKHMGTIQFSHSLQIMPEDSMNVNDFGDGELTVAVVAYPYMSNFNEFQALASSNVSVRFVRRPKEALKADLVILPGSKSVFASLKWLIDAGFVDVLKRRPVYAICGGFQMLARRLVDPFGLESPANEFQGLGFFDIEVRYDKTKRVRLTRGDGYFGRLEGYEIRRGRLIYGRSSPIINLGDVEDGALQDQVVGLSVHGSLYSEFGKNFASLFGIKVDSSSLIEEVRKQVESVSSALRSQLDLDAIRSTWEQGNPARA
ncbi:cobyric acid synthase CobQ [Sulfodiicoccus acidiphilus]|uniref:Probable cobyric acid synthase n=2 Tax=Sulfodiicoccus acidiphilus TaxID=1670455 RepID=A0A348B3M6_9CREN|nr:cobyric acid synthase CobQ [Sulfodiicoccus acidiphilus]GGT99731.1 cobyric acid synthase CobQ [Sulfodiicoccus acidiphilus]